MELVDVGDKPQFSLRRLREYIFNAMMASLAFTGLIFYLFCRKKQPLRSRQFFPPLCSTLLFVFYSVMTISIIMSDLGVFPLYYDIVEFWGTLMGDMSALLPIFGMNIIIIRFLLFQNLSFNQQRYLKILRVDQQNQSNGTTNSDKSLEYIRKKAKIAQFLLSKKVFVISLIAFMIVQIPILIAIGIFGTFRYSWINIARRTNILLTSVLIISSTLLCFTIDVIIHFKLIITSIRRYFIERDRLFVRLDLFIGIVGMFITAVVFAILTIIEQNHFLMYIVIILDIIRVIMFVSVVCGMNCSIIVISDYLKSMVSSSVSSVHPLNDKDECIIYGDAEMMQCLLDEDGLELFYSYAKAEFSTENIECWKYIQAYKKMTPEKRCDHLKIMYDLFISSKSVLEVNVTQNGKRAIVEAVNNGVTPNTLDNKLLIELEKEILMNLFDSFQRLNLTGSYKQFKIALEFKKTQIELLSADANEKG